jgi:hypothetical protein
MADKLILLADLGRLKAFRLSRDEMTTTPRLDLIQDIQLVDAHGRLRDKVTDMAGRFPSGDSTNGAGMSIGENHNLMLDMERRLVKQIGAGINEVVERAGGGPWYFAAPSTINQRVLDELKPAVRASMAKNVSADLVNVETSELIERF